MKTLSLSLLFSVFGVIGFSGAHAQDQLHALQIREVHLANSMGWGFPLGRTKDVLKPKYSTNLGLDIDMKNPRYFLFPSLDFLAFKYEQQVADPENRYLIERGNSHFYLLNLAAGRRIRRNNLAFHAYVGPGVGMVSEPRATGPADGVIRLKSNYSITPTLRLGAGSHYQLGSVRLFLDLSYLHLFREMQHRPVHVLVVYGGLRTNITRVADRVVEIISDQSP